jgi:hypothetical protein
MSWYQIVYNTEKINTNAGYVMIGDVDISE